MGGGMDLLQLLDRDLGVNLGGREFGMVKELLDKADIRAAFKHLCGASVAKQVAGARVYPVPRHRCSRVRAGRAGYGSKGCPRYADLPTH